MRRKARSLGMRKSGFAACLALLVWQLGCSNPPAATGELEAGKPAPNFKLPDLNGNQVTLEQFKGKVVLLDFWATWCGPCRMSMPQLERLQAQYPSDLALLAINLQEERDQVSSYVRSENIHSRVLLDEQGEVARVYRAGAIPFQVLIDKTGIIRHTQMGFSPRMTDSFRELIEQLRNP
jgi:thiol-disulfide isomerase/thioredoxin